MGEFFGWLIGGIVALVILIGGVWFLADQANNHTHTYTECSAGECEPVDP